MAQRLRILLSQISMACHHEHSLCRLMFSVAHWSILCLVNFNCKIHTSFENLRSSHCSKSNVSCKHVKSRLTSKLFPSTLRVAFDNIPLKSSFVPSQNDFESTSLTFQLAGKIEAWSSSYVLSIRLSQAYRRDILSREPAYLRVERLTLG